MTGFWRVSRWRVAVAACIALVCLLSSGNALADARAAYLIKLLEGSSQFRVRAQAAISLGSVSAEPAVVQALGKALEDQHPAVRAAAATSLGRLGDPAALDALRGAARDREPPVRVAVKVAIAKLESHSGRVESAARPSTSRGPPRFYVAIGKPASRVPSVAPSVLSDAHAFLQGAISQLDGVVLAPAGETTSAARKVLTRKKLKGYYIESSIVEVQQRPGGGTRVVVSVIVATYPGRDMRAIVKGAATAMGSGPGTYGQAVQGALNSAMRKLPAAFR